MLASFLATAFLLGSSIAQRSDTNPKRKLRSDDGSARRLESFDIVDESSSSMSMLMIEESVSDTSTAAADTDTTENFFFDHHHGDQCGEFSSQFGDTDKSVFGNVFKIKAKQDILINGFSLLSESFNSTFFPTTIKVSRSYFF